MLRSEGYFDEWGICAPVCGDGAEEWTVGQGSRGGLIRVCVSANSVAPTMSPDVEYCFPEDGSVAQPIHLEALLLPLLSNPPSLHLYLASSLKKETRQCQNTTARHSRSQTNVTHLIENQLSNNTTEYRPGGVSGFGSRREVPQTSSPKAHQTIWGMCGQGSTFEAMI